MKAVSGAPNVRHRQSGVRTQLDVQDGGTMREGWPIEPVADVAARRDALRHAADTPGADARALLDAALTELDGAIDALASDPAGGAGNGSAADSLPEAVRAERRLLHATFQETPVALFLLEQDGTIRRANNAAGALLGSPSGYATGKPLTAFVDLPSRAAVQTQLAAVVRNGKARQANCRLLTADGTLDVTVTAAAIELPGDPPLIVVTATSGARSAADPATAKRTRPRQSAAAGDPVKSMIKRMDLVTEVTRLLLDNSTFSEAVSVQRFARLLAGEIADWVIVDIDRGGRLRRQIATGPRNRQSEDFARAIRGVDPEPESVPSQVHATRKSLLLAHADDPGVLGAGPGGVPLLMRLGATSLMSVPICDATTSYGALTLARLADKGHFEVADLSLAERLGEHLAIAIRVDRMFRHRSEAAEALQASLLPARLPTVPGLELTAAYVGATESQEISGDFYDVFRYRDGWAIAIGDVCGKGQDAAAMTAAARHSIRALARAHSSPGDVLAAVNEVLVAGDYEERFVTAKLAFLEREGQRLRVRLASSGHPGPAVVRADARVELLEGDGLPLGLFADAKPASAELELRQGDLLFFYTDGVTDARSADLEFFEDRLADVLAAVAADGGNAAETVRAVQDLVTAFSQGELRDDVTMLAVKLTLED
jgi:serine phosphatase RsbU (regulator of sigma subunit)/PAS domain-containing protein